MSAAGGPGRVHRERRSDDEECGTMHGGEPLRGSTVGRSDDPRYGDDAFAETDGDGVRGVAGDTFGRALRAWVGAMRSPRVVLLSAVLGWFLPLVTCLRMAFDPGFEMSVWTAWLSRFGMAVLYLSLPRATASWRIVSLWAMVGTMGVMMWLDKDPAFGQADQFSRLGLGSDAAIALLIVWLGSLALLEMAGVWFERDQLVWERQRLWPRL